MTILFDRLFFSSSGLAFWGDMFLYFSFFAILGWLIEMIYLSTAGRGLINSGFLQGPFCPAYAVGGVILYPLIFLASGFPIWLQLIFFAFLCSAIEYVAHFTLELILGIRIWDYSDEPLNLHGRVSLKYTFFWFFLVGGVMIIFQPGAVTMIESFSPAVRRSFLIIFLLTFPADYIYSMVIFGKYSKTIKEVCHRFNLPEKELHDLQFNRPRIMKEKKRVKKLFKDPEYRALAEEVREKILLHDRVLIEDPDFSKAIEDIRENSLFIDWYEHKPKNFDTYIRPLRIAEIAWRFCTEMGYDRVTAARGALLCAYKRKRMTPKGRASSAFFPQTTVYLWVKQDFAIENKVEKDVILWYKWPLNFKAPATMEGLMVSFADKIMKSLEFRRVVAQIYENQLSQTTVAVRGSEES